MLLGKGHQPDENHDRWIISYADFVTLLCALFVVLFASSAADKRKAHQMADSFRRTSGQLSATLASAFGIPAPEDPSEAARLAKALEWLKSELSEEVKQGRLDLQLERRGLVVSMREASCFQSGDDKVSTDAHLVLEKLAAVARRLNCPIRLEGHTDSVPIRTGRFQSNWELSSARSIAVMEILAQRFAIPKDRMSVSGYADNFPVDSNESNEGRSRNRRVDVVFLGEEARIANPAARRRP